MAEPEQILDKKETTVVIAKSGINPEDFFKSSESLFVWTDFTDRIVSKAEPLATDVKFKIDSFNLSNRASDGEIETMLPEQHIFNESEVCAIIASLIELQPKGKAGILLNNGYANLFYTPACVVLVRWGSFDGYWGVDAWSRGGVGWRAGCRVFSAATKS